MGSYDVCRKICHGVHPCNCCTTITLPPTHLAPDHAVGRALFQCLGTVDVCHTLAEVKLSLLAGNHPIYPQQRCMVLLCALVPAVMHDWGCAYTAAGCNQQHHVLSTQNQPQGHAVGWHRHTFDIPTHCRPHRACDWCNGRARMVKSIVWRLDAAQRALLLLHIPDSFPTHGCL